MEQEMLQHSGIEVKSNATTNWIYFISPLWKRAACEKATMRLMASHPLWRTRPWGVPCLRTTLTGQADPKHGPLKDVPGHDNSIRGYLASSTKKQINFQHLSHKPVQSWSSSGQMWSAWVSWLLIGRRTAHWTDVTAALIHQSCTRNRMNIEELIIQQENLL